MVAKTSYETIIEVDNIGEGKASTQWFQLWCHATIMWENF